MRAVVKARSPITPLFCRRATEYLSVGGLLWSPVIVQEPGPSSGSGIRAHHKPVLRGSSDQTRVYDPRTSRRPPGLSSPDAQAPADVQTEAVLVQQVMLIHEIRLAKENIFERSERAGSPRSSSLGSFTEE